MKKQVKLAASAGKVVKTTISGYNDLVIVFEDDTFCFLHPVNGYDNSDADFEEPEFWDHFWNWCISKQDIIASGMATTEECAEMERKREAAWKAVQEARDREQYERLKAKFDPSVTR